MAAGGETDEFSPRLCFDTKRRTAVEALAEELSAIIARDYAPLPSLLALARGKMFWHKLACWLGKDITISHRRLCRRRVFRHKPPRSYFAPLLAICSRN